MSPKQRHILGSSIGERWREVTAFANIDESKVKREARGSVDPFELSHALVTHMAGDAFPLSKLKKALLEAELTALVLHPELGLENVESN